MYINIHQFFQLKPYLYGYATRMLSEINSRKLKPTVDPYTGTASFTHDCLIVNISNYDAAYDKLNIRLHKLLDVIILNFSTQNRYKDKSKLNTEVFLPLSKFMFFSNKPSTRASKNLTRVNINNSLKTLRKISLSWSESFRTKEKEQITKEYTDVMLFEYAEYCRGNICVKFSFEMASYLNSSYVMNYPLTLLGVDERNPSLYHIGKKLAMHASINNNKKKGTSSTIRVSSLLSACMTIPTVDDVYKTGRQYKPRIIEPFINALNSLDFIEWNFIDNAELNNEALFLQSKDIHCFLDKKIHFEILCKVKCS